MAKKSGVKVGKNSKKNQKLDYTYGEEEVLANKKIDNSTIDDDYEIVEREMEEESEINEDKEELIIGSQKRMNDKRQKDNELHERALSAQEERRLKQKYLGYSDFITNGYDSNGYKFDENDDFKSLDTKGWNMVIGYVLIRIFAPLILIFHGIVVGLVLWKVYEFDFTPESKLSKDNAMPWIAGAMSLNVFIVHYVSKYLFSNNYYKLRKQHQLDISRKNQNQNKK